MKSQGVSLSTEPLKSSNTNPYSGFNQLPDPLPAKPPKIATTRAPLGLEAVEGTLDQIRP